ncbi:MAG: hypothetical protein WAU24_04860 [Chitinophagaceae bacterium]
MKTIALLLFAIVLYIGADSQPLPDSIKAKYQSAISDEQKGECLVSYFKTQSLTDSTANAQTLSLLSWFASQKDELGKDYTNLRLAQILETKGDLPAALNLLFSILPNFEKRQDSSGLVYVYNAIANTYMASKDYVQAAAYTKKAIPFALAKNDKFLLAKLYNGIACVYGEGKMPDSGMVYAQNSVNLATELKLGMPLAIATSTLGENYIAAGQYDIALPFLRRTFDYYKKYNAPSPHLDAYLKNDFAEVFLATKMYDSVNYYARQALKVSIPFEEKEQSMRAYEYLYKSFEQTNNQDSLNKYFRLAMTTKDSLFSMEKIKSIQALSFREDLRQQEIATEKLKAEEERQQNIQYASIALGIIILITLFLLLSRSVIVNEKLISFFAILGLLIIFEFINLLIHPWLAHFTHESPVLMLLALVLIAALLIPIHHKMEHIIKEKLVEKNKAIRLAAAKKTIEKLEGESN